MNQDILVNTYFTKEVLGFEPTEHLRLVAKIFSRRSDVFRAVVNSFSSLKQEYHFQPMIGAHLDFIFDDERICITRGEQSQILSKNDFLRYLEIIDKLYGEILPLGSIVLLDAEMLPKEIAVDLPESTALYVLITGRKVLLPNHQYLDYTGEFWPEGLRSGQEPIVFSSSMIAEVVFRGLENNHLEDDYQLSLRRELLSEDRKSLFYKSLARKVSNYDSSKEV